MNYKNKLLQYFSIVGIIVFILIIWYLNHITLYTSDDHRYFFFYESYLPIQPIKQITSFTDIIHSQINHFFLWNGRFIAHTWVQFAMKIPKEVFNCVNTVFFILLTLIIKKICENILREKLSVSYLFIILLLLWILLPEIGKTILWLSGSGNYLFTSLIYMSFLLAILTTTKNTFSLPNCLILLLGLLTGATNENSGPAILFLCIALYFLNFNKSKFLLLGSMLGTISFLIMLSSPSSLSRGDISIHFSDIRHNLALLINNLLYQYNIFLISIPLTLYYANKRHNIRISRYIYIIYATIVISILPLLLIAELPLRTLFLPSILFCILMIIYIRQYKMIMPFVLFGLTCFYIASLSNILPDNHRSYKTDFQNRIQIQLSKDNNQSNQCTILTPIPYNTHNLYNPYNGTSNLTYYENSWYNMWMSAYYGIPCIITR